MHQIDQGVGRIVAALNASRFRDDTVIIFASDHGDFLGDYDLIGKHLFYEPSIRVPLIVKLPRLNPARSVDSLVSLTDVTATILALAGVDRSGWGDSIVLPELGLPQTRSRDHVFGATDFGLMVIADEWKLCRYKNGHVALYNLIDDPHEQRNLAYQPHALSEMHRLDAHLAARSDRLADGRQRRQVCGEVALSGARRIRSTRLAAALPGQSEGTHRDERVENES